MSNSVTSPPPTQEVSAMGGPSVPIPTNAASVSLPPPVNPPVPAATNLAAQATNQTGSLSGTNTTPVAAKAASLLDLLPFFERPVKAADGTNTVRILAPVFLPPRNTGPTPGSTARYESPP